ncbi:MAG: Gfo/Idh/MocA family oxidoreductase [Chloroflexi bacterium]|nr:Gfo/Idh/MocA family oxidoreductase [Chloroflexota bacterium]
MTAPRVAIVGCGRIAREGHVPAYAAAAAAGRCRLVGVCDVDAGRARDLGAAAGVPAFTSVDELLATARPEVVSITTMPDSHRDLTERALAAGCHVLCEKPIALTVAEAEAMVAAADRAGRLLSICFEYRTWDEARYLRERIAAGDLGDVLTVRTWGGGVHGFPRGRGFHDRAVAGGGVLTHWTIHNLDLALWLLGHPEPLTASAVCRQRLAHVPPVAFVGALAGIDAAAVDPDIEDLAVGLVRLAGGAALTVEANWLQPPSTRPEGWEILGTRGAAAIAPLRIWHDRGDAWVDATPSREMLAPCDYRMDRLIDDFLAAAHQGGPAPVAGAEIVRIQRLMNALYASATVGHEVAITVPA